MIKRQKDTAFRKFVGKNLNEHIKATGLTKTEFSKQMGLCRNNINKIIRGTHCMSIRTLVNFCYELGITPNDLLDYHQPVRRKK